MVKNYLKMLLKRKENQILTDICNQKQKLTNDYSYSKNDYNFMSEPKDIPINNNEYTIYDINYLLNRPEISYNIQ